LSPQRAHHSRLPGTHNPNADNGRWRARRICDLLLKRSIGRQLLTPLLRLLYAPLSGLSFSAISCPSATLFDKVPTSRAASPVRADIKLHLRRSAEAIGRRLRQKGHIAFGVGVKLKTTDFQILTHQRRLSEATDVTERLYSVGVDLLIEFNHPGPFRLVGSPTTWSAIDGRAQLDLSAPLLGNAAWRSQLMNLPSDLVPTSCSAPTISPSHQGCAWRRPLTSWTTAHAVRGPGAFFYMIQPSSLAFAFAAGQANLRNFGNVTLRVSSRPFRA